MMLNRMMLFKDLLYYEYCYSSFIREKTKAQGGETLLSE